MKYFPELYQTRGGGEAPSSPIQSHTARKSQSHDSESACAAPGYFSIVCLPVLGLELGAASSLALQ